MESGPTFTPPCFCRDFREAGVAVGPDSNVAPMLVLVRKWSKAYMMASSSAIERAVMAKNSGILAESLEGLNEQKLGKPLTKKKEGYHLLKISDLKELFKKEN